MENDREGTTPAGDVGGNRRVSMWLLAGVPVALFSVAIGVAVVVLLARQQVPSEGEARGEPQPDRTATREPAEEREARSEPSPARQAEPEGIARELGDAVFKVEAAGCGVVSLGTAFAVDEHHLVTNFHVVAVDPQPLLISRSGERLQGQVIGWRARPDVAVLRVSEVLPRVLEWASTDQLREGQSLVALGYPLPAGDFTVTPGTILSFQTRDGLREAIRSDAALDKGNSGGPALDAEGNVIGVATQMAMGTDFQTVPLLFTHSALSSTVEALMESAEVPSAPHCSAAIPNVLPDTWQPPPPRAPTGYGDDSILDLLWNRCTAGDMVACDELYVVSSYGSDYERFARTCGDRNRPSGWCVQVHASERASGIADLPRGLFCRDLHARGYNYAEAIEYWNLEGRPDRMDASRNGIPCQTVYPPADVWDYWGGSGVASLPSGLFCRDLRATGHGYAEAVDYWILEGRPDRMDASRNGIPCQTVYPPEEVQAHWAEG